MICNHVTRLAALKDKVYRTNPHSLPKNSERKTYEEKYWKFIRMNIFE